MIGTRSHRRRAPVVFVSLLATALCVPAAAHAHVPVLEPRAPSTADPADAGAAGTRLVEPPDESRAIYGTLAPAERVDSYSFTAPRDIETTIEVLVPARSGNADTEPEIAFSVVGGEGGETRAEPVAGEEFFEPFSLQRFQVVASQPYRFEAGTSYTLLIVPADPSEPRERTVPYVIAFSGAERFTPREWLSSAAYVPRIWLGLYGQWAPRWGMIAGVALLLGLVVFVVVRRTRHRRGVAL